MLRDSPRLSLFYAERCSLYTFPMFPSKVLLGVIFASSLYAAADCRLPENLFAHRPNDLFSDARETDLGDAADEQIARSLRVIEAPQEVAFLSHIASQLLANAPVTNIKFRFTLIDSPDANAFSLPGGHIYVTRKLVALLQGPDEVAAVIGHEMGHILSHQGSLAMSREMRRVLKIESLETREDVFKQYALLTEAYLNPRNQRTVKDREQEDQVAADRISVSLLLAAGYNPGALVTALDRITGSGGQHGNLFTDIFGITPAEGKRIRELEKTVDRLPSACPPTEQPVQASALTAWQDRVLKLTVSQQAANLPGLLSVRRLTPALVSDMQYIHFSPNGQFALAQDSASIHVLSISPFKVLFDIPASGAETPQFSPDSASISFVTDTLRYEKWDIASAKQTAVHELQFPKGCLAHRLSPTGNLFACVQHDQTLSLSRIADGEVVFEKNVAASFGSDPTGILTYLYSLIPPSLEFSPNESWLLLTHPVEAAGGTLLLDLHSFKPTKFSQKAQTALASSFIFLKDDQVLTQGSRTEQGAVLQLPGLDVLESLVVPSGRMVPLSNPGFVLIESEGKYAALVANLAEKTIVMGSALPALDIRENLRLSGSGAGQLRLAKDKTQFGMVTLDNPKLGADLRMSSSSDWMALSNASRAAVWNTSSGNGFLSAPFEHAEFQEGNMLQLVTAPYLEQKQMEVIINLDKQAYRKGEQSDEDPAKAATHFWNGAVRFVLKQTDKDSTLEAYDGLGAKSLWTETFINPPFPALTLSPELLAVTWPANSPQGSKLIKADPDLKKEKAQTAWGACVLQVRNVRTGEVIKQRLVSTLDRTSLAVKGHVLQTTGVTLAGKWIVLQQPENRIMIQRWDDGSVVARSFGLPLVFDPAKAKLVIQNRERELKTIDLNTGAEGPALQFPERIVAAAFRQDGQQLTAVTADQQVYLLASQ